MKKRTERRTECIHIDEELIRLADDLRSAIVKCDSMWMRGPTIHMDQAITNYDEYKKRNNIL